MKETLVNIIIYILVPGIKYRSQISSKGFASYINLHWTFIDKVVFIFSFRGKELI